MKSKAEADPFRFALTGPHPLHSRPQVRLGRTLTLEIKNDMGSASKYLPQESPASPGCLSTAVLRPHPPRLNPPPAAHKSSPPRASADAVCGRPRP